MAHTCAIARTLLAVITLSFAATAAAAAGPKLKHGEVMLTGDYPPLTERDKTLTSVDFAPGAPAVVLFEGEQYVWLSESVETKRVRRVKILTEAGVADHGDFEWTAYGEWRIKEIRARTILPDGTIVDASKEVHVEVSKDPDITEIKLAFPRVQVGAILDVAIDANVNNVRLNQIVLQENIPVLERRFVIDPLEGIRYRTAAVRLPPEQAQPIVLTSTMGQTFAWIFKDSRPIPPLANLPAMSDISQKLLLIPESYRSGGYSIPLSTDWKVFLKRSDDDNDEWMKKKNTKASQLAREVTAGATTPASKAEAIRKALRTRVNSVSDDWSMYMDSPDHVLEQGKGSSADIAGLAAHMLRTVDVPAKLAGVRQKSSGTLPPDVPVPTMLDDLLVVIPGGGAAGADLYFDASSDLPVGLLSNDHSGILAAVFDRKGTGPSIIPEPLAADAHVERQANAKLGLDGKLTGEVLITVTGRSAQGWRRVLQGMTPDERKKDMETDLQNHMPSARLTAHVFENLDDPLKDLLITLGWEAEGYATRAGNRLLVNPFLFERESADDWAPETREYEIDLGPPHQISDSIAIEVPEGVIGITLPAPVKLEAGPVGLYQTTHEGKGRIVRTSRMYRLDHGLFPKASYPGLKSWFTDMATADDQSIVMTLAP